MAGPVDLLMIPWNRRPYVEKTLARLLADPADFRLYCWDNGSADGAADVVASCADERIAGRHVSDENVMQTVPTLWFLEQSGADIVGKVDDDTLVPAGWTETIAPALREHSKLGMVGCWTFWPEDYERNRARASRKIVAVGEHEVLRDAMIGGTAFLVRRDLARQYLQPGNAGREFPIDRMRMTADGYISGWYHPLLWAEHMDDPRSEHCLMNAGGGMNRHAALTARTRQMTTPEQYLNWIKTNADEKLGRAVWWQMKLYQWRLSRWRRWAGRLTGMCRRACGCPL